VLADVSLKRRHSSVSVSLPKNLRLAMEKIRQTFKKA